MNNSKRFLFVWWEGGGNMPPALHVTRQLVARGHGVHVLGDPVSERDFCEVGASFAPFRRAPHRVDRKPEGDPLRDWEAKNPKQALAMIRDRLLFGPALGYAEDTLEQIRLYRPDALAIMDFTFGAMMAAERANIPAAVVAPHILTYPVRGRPPFGPGLLPARNVFERLRDAIISSLSLSELGKGLTPFNVARQKLGLDSVRAVFDQVERMNRILVLTSPALELPGGPLPENVRYTGPVLVDPPWAEPWAGPWPAGDRDPLVLVGFSTTFQNQQAVVSRVIEALSRLPVRGLVTLGRSLDPKAFAAPRNVIVCPSAPHSQLLPFAAVMVTHAGHGSVVRALSHGIPLVCVPMGRDQNDIAARVVYHGAGLRVSQAASVNQLTDAVKRALSEEAFRKRAERLGATIRSDARNSTTVTELEQLASRTDRDLERRVG
ncbi:MAG: nucleotide disphospho-sugar-binding domain-containing protein [Bryobacteraceae bacterium]